MAEVEAIWTESMDAFRQHRTWRRAKRLGFGQLACLGRHTIASLICAGGRQGDDWSADYRLFARDKWHVDDLFAPVVRGVLHMLPSEAPLVVAMDDTSLRKTGRKIPGVGYRRDPMSPPFHVNLVTGQRFIQLSAMVPAGPAPSSARGVPVRWRHCPPVPKPKASADEETKKTYRNKCREKNLSTCGRDQIKQLRHEMDHIHHAKHRRMVVAVDGSYTKRMPSSITHPAQSNKANSAGNAATATSPTRRKNCEETTTYRGSLSRPVLPEEPTHFESKK